MKKKIVWLIISCFTILFVYQSNNAFANEINTSYSENSNDYNVNIPDENLKKALNHELGQVDDEPISKNKLESLTKLVFVGLKISNLEGVQYCTNLTELNVCDNKISDLSPLKGLTKLEKLSLNTNKISDLSPLKDMTNLKSLYAMYLQVSDISPLKDMTKLENLTLGWNQISDISPLKNMTNLQYLLLSVNYISDISPLKNMTNMGRLELAHNPISDLSPLKNMTKMWTMDLRMCEISDLSPIKGMPELNDVDATNQYIYVKLPTGFTNNVEYTNPLKDIDGKIITPNEISSNGVYDSKSNKIIWNNLTPNDSLTCKFDSKIKIPKGKGSDNEYSGGIYYSFTTTTGDTPAMLQVNSLSLPTNPKGPGETIPKDVPSGTNFALLFTPEIFNFGKLENFKQGDTVTQIIDKEESVGIGDLRSANSGWQLTAKASELNNNGNKLLGDISMDTSVKHVNYDGNSYSLDQSIPKYAVAQTPTASGKVTLNLGGDSKIIMSAIKGKGMGLWATNMSNIKLNSTNTGDLILGTYSGNVDWNLSSTPI